MKTVKEIKIKTISTKEEGCLSFFEANKEIPFDIKRVYFTYGVPEGTKRGAHAHRTLKQVLFCPYGKVEVILDDGAEKKSIVLEDPATGLIIENLVWRDLVWRQKDSVLCAAVSDYFDKDEYIRDYEDFLKECLGEA